MANDQGDVVIIIASENQAVNEKSLDKLDHGPPLKKMKQGRLPFKPLDHAGQVRQGNTPPGSKKRKLSDNESPSAKQLRTSAVAAAPKPLIGEGENEVSSSSETDHLSDSSSLKSGKKLGTIDKFFQRKPITVEPEISSTNQKIDIDLTDDIEECKIDSDLSKSPEALKENKVSSEPCDLEEVTTKVSLDQDAPDENADKLKNEEEVISSSESKDATESMEDCTEQDDGTENEDEVSFIEETSVCEDALKTPKSKTLESILKTPVGTPACSSKTPVTPGQTSASENTPISNKKRRTPLSESQRKEREHQRQKREKEREEKRLAKEREREEKKRELAEKKRQKEEQAKKEKAEKDKQKQEEKEKREKERLEKLKLKEEERKLKEKETEAKKEEKKKREEEKRQKDEEKKQKEEEKLRDEEEKQRKAEKNASMFKGFFIKKDMNSSPPKPKDTKTGLFMPFELKPQMRLAPDCRRIFSDEDKQALDEQLNLQTSDDTFLNTVKQSGFKARRSSKTWPRLNRVPEDDDDIELLSHEKETIDKVTHKVKFLKFHENTRPPYYGTWRKTSKALTPKNPFKQDEVLFDYEVDSDDEWEEEEPGESVSSDENDDDEDKEKVEEEEGDDGWMVPHGYLSDGEGIEDDEEVDVASKQDLQRVRQAAWESELKRQAKPVKLLAIGCVWQDSDTTTIAAQQLEKLLKYKAVCLLEGPIHTSLSGGRETIQEKGSDRGDEKPAAKSQLKKSVPEEAMPDLIRLIHGNPCGIKNLVKEFRMYWRRKTNPGATEPNTADLNTSQADISMEVEGVAPGDSTSGKAEATSLPEKGSKSPSQGEFAISKRQLEMKIPQIAVREKRPEHRKICWYVNEAVLKKYNMEDIQLPNSWTYVCIKEPLWAQEKVVVPKPEEPSAELTGKPQIAAKPAPSIPSIMQFTQPMSPAQILAQCVIPPAAGSSIVDPVENSAEKASEAPLQMDTSDSSELKETPGKSLPPDQRSIKDMFSPTVKKSLTPTAITPGKSSNEKVSGSPVIKILEGAKTDKKDSKELTNCIIGNVTPTRPTAQNPVLKTMLSSPELMKTSPKPSAQSGTETGQREEPMEVDIIVLD